MNYSINRLPIVFISFLLLNAVFLGWRLANFVLIGDDIYSLLYIPSNIDKALSSFINFSGQYRPLAYLGFIIYKPFAYNFSAVYSLHILIFTALQTFFFYAIKKNSSRLVYAWLFTIAVFINPVFYHHIFTIASDINIYILISFLAIFIFLRKKRYYWAGLIFIISIFIKETFIVSLPLLIYSIMISGKSVGYKLRSVSFFLIIAAVYSYLRLTFYKVVDPDYSFVITPQKAKENITSIAAWIMSHPRGPQYYFYGFRNIGNYFADMLWSILWLAGLFKSFIYNKSLTIILICSLIVSILPFVFLNRLMVYYIDLPFIILSLLAARLLAHTYAKYIVALILFTSILTNVLFLQKWIKWSYVGTANTIARNYISAVDQIDWSGKKSLCIINHSAGSWPTLNGELLRFVHRQFEGTITSSPKDDPSFCQGKLILRNSGGEYKWLSKP